MRVLSPLLVLVVPVALAACTGLRTYVHPTNATLNDAYACAQTQLQELEYTVVLSDSVGGLLQAHREITGIRESARRGASAATGVITGGIAGGSYTRYDELTIFFYTRRYPYGNTVEATAGLLTIGEGTRERGAPTDAAKEDVRQLLARCFDEV